MKYPLIIVSTFTLIAAFVISGCDKPSNKMDKAETELIEAKRDLEIAKSEVKAELRIFRAENADQIKEYKRLISDIKHKIDAESDKDVKVKLEKKLDKFEESLSSLQNDMDNYEVSGRENWADFKDSFTRRMDDLGDSLEDFFSPLTNTVSSN